MEKALVYVIDDDDLIRETMFELLNDEYEVLTFQSGDVMCQHFSGQFSKYFFGCFK
ncbi:hypothetical protein [sulfur-oxidizing endosymbiont of Gigantopelta aegis]|uniref:hypothetical protein n=1 Tax=sulfur-oxidizing endosymbiont of Gigantopelta aegis TaxID=2794934 RepID=UPI0018DE5E1D|nr:hypothetical protein [sulfur-oxidizing endosymbiont of Gigantopelta aegis]